jgi:hypothetical protein
LSPFLQNWQFCADVLGAIAAFVAICFVGMGVWALISSERVTSWVRSHVITAGWMTLLFVVLLFGPGYLPEPVQSLYSPWRLLVVAIPTHLHSGP